MVKESLSAEVISESALRKENKPVIQSFEVLRDIRCRKKASAQTLRWNGSSRNRKKTCGKGLVPKSERGESKLEMEAVSLWKALGTIVGRLTLIPGEQLILI